MTPEDIEIEKILIAESWQKCDLRHKLHKGQRLIHASLDQSTEKLFVANCSRQWGKSYLMVCRAIECALKTPKARVKYATGFMSDLVEFILPTFNLILEDCPHNLKPVFRRGNKFKFPNGSEILLLGLDKHPDALRGNTIDLIILDEVAFMDNLESTYKNIILPAMLHRPKGKVIMITTPPQSPAHDFIEFVHMAQVTGNYKTFTIYDNPMLSPEQIAEAMKGAGGADSTTWKREYLCQFVTEEKQMVIQEWATNGVDCVRPRVKDKAYDFHRKYIGMDVGVKDFTVGVFGHYNYAHSTLYIEDEFRVNDKDVTVENIAKMIKQKRTALWGENMPYRGISDIDKLLIQSLNANHKETFHAVSKRSLIDMVQSVRAMVKNKQIIVDPKCVQVLGCLNSAIWDAGSMRTQEFKQFARSKAYGHFDALAALIYLVISLDRNTDPVPAHFGIEFGMNTLCTDPEKYNKVPKSIKAIAKTFVPPWKNK